MSIDTYSPMVIYGAVLKAVKLGRMQDVAIDFIDKSGERTEIRVEPNGDLSAVPKGFLDDFFTVLGKIDQAYNKA